MSASSESTPVFVDATGRRRRVIRGFAIALLGIVGAYGFAVVLSFLGGPVPPNALLPLPDPPSAAVSTPAAHGNPNAATSHGSPTNTGSGNAAPGTAPLSGQPGTSAPSVSPSTSASASAAASTSPSPTASRHVPPGHVGRSASPGPTNGHGH